VRKTMTGITNPTEEYFKDGLWGWDGTQWRKLGLALWYYEPYSEDLSGTATGSSYVARSTTVPTGFVYIVNAASVGNFTRAAEYAEIRLYTDTDAMIYLVQVISPALYQPAIFTGNLVLSPGWTIYLRVDGCAVDDTILAGVAGYKVKIT